MNVKLQGGVGKNTLTKQTKLGGTFTLPNTSLSLCRTSYGAMQLAGPGVWGLPRDLDAAVAVLREAVTAGVNHIDTSDFYGPSVTNQLIKQVLHPYPAGLVIVTKLGYRRGPGKSWLPALSRQELIQGVHDNLRNLGLDTLDVVNLRVGGTTRPSEGSIEEPLTVLAALQNRGLFRHLGVSNVTPNQLIEAQKITNIVCVQNLYNVANRNDDEFIDQLAKRQRMNSRRKGCLYRLRQGSDAFGKTLITNQVRVSAPKAGVEARQICVAFWILSLGSCRFSRGGRTDRRFFDKGSDSPRLFRSTEPRMLPQNLAEGYVGGACLGLHSPGCRED
jgi:diketogulonate reductase-like aldo/keto reductase